MGWGGAWSAAGTSERCTTLYSNRRRTDKSGGAKGHFNYVNHVNGLHVDGPVNDIVVIAFNGTCGGDGCTFSVTVEDHGEPGTKDQFGITVTAAVSEVRSQRVISGGNIQFHE